MKSTSLVSSTPDTPTQPQTHLSRRSFLRWGCGVLLATGLSGAGGVVYGYEIEPQWPQLVRVKLSLPNWPVGLPPFTIAQLTDLHVGPFIAPEHISRVVERVLALEPDMIVLTGDLISRSPVYVRPCLQSLAPLQARLGVYAVLGNHDVWVAPTAVAEGLGELGFTVLRDSARELSVGQARIWMVGMEDPGYTQFSDADADLFIAAWRAKERIYQHVMAELPSEEFKLLLVHNPDFNEFCGVSVNLALSGHTHGGQVRLPLYGPLVLPSVFGRKYASGLVQGPYSPVYVSRGIGVTAPPVRFNCRPEITLLSLASVEQG